MENRLSADLGLMEASLHGSSPALAQRWCPGKAFLQPPLDDWNRGGGPIGSQNFQPSYWAIHGGERGVRALAQISQSWQREGFLGREYGSEVYTPSVLLSLVLGLHEADRLHMGEEKADIKWALEVSWAWLTLLSHPLPIQRAFTAFAPRRARNNEHNILLSEHKTGRPPSQWSNTPTVCLAGDRQNAAHVYQKPLGLMLSIALDVPGRKNRRYSRESRYSICARALASACARRGTLLKPNPSSRPVPPLNREVSAESVGMDPFLRDLCLTALYTGEHRRTLAEFLAQKKFKIWKDYIDNKILLSFSSSGGIAGVTNYILGSANRNKPSWPIASIYTRLNETVGGTVYEVYQPSKFKRTGATKPKSALERSSRSLHFVSEADLFQIRKEINTATLSMVFSLGPDGVKEEEPIRIRPRGLL